MYAIVAANVAVFLHQLTLDAHAHDLFAFEFGVVPWLLTEQRHLASLSTPFTSMFLHGDFVHLASNMWFLWVFGDNVEEALGRLRFAGFYVACGLAAVLAHVFVEPNSRIPMVGASGAISGVLAAYFRLFPGARIITLIPVFFIPLIRELPAVFFIVFWFGIQLLYGFGSLAAGAQGGIAFFAHVGGFVGGLLLLSWFTAPKPRALPDAVIMNQRFDRFED